VTGDGLAGGVDLTVEAVDAAGEPEPQPPQPATVERTAATTRAAVTGIARRRRAVAGERAFMSPSPGTGRTPPWTPFRGNNSRQGRRAHLATTILQPRRPTGDDPLFFTRDDRSLLHRSARAPLRQVRGAEAVALIATGLLGVRRRSARLPQKRPKLWLSNASSTSSISVSLALTNPLTSPGRAVPAAALSAFGPPRRRDADRAPTWRRRAGPRWSRGDPGHRHRSATCPPTPAGRRC
jgi:hypothetical protein